MRRLAQKEGVLRYLRGTAHCKFFNNFSDFNMMRRYFGVATQVVKICARNRNIIEYGSYWILSLTLTPK